jgi:Type IV secretion system pilin
MTPQAKAAAEAASFVTKVNDIILFPLIALLSAVAFLYFVWGGAEYFFNAASDQAREQGKKHMMYGIIGLVIMVSAYGLLKVATGTFGLDQELKCADNPSASGCTGAFKI